MNDIDKIQNDENEQLTSQNNLLKNVVILLILGLIIAGYLTYTSRERIKELEENLKKEPSQKKIDEYKKEIKQITENDEFEVPVDVMQQITHLMKISEDSPDLTQELSDIIPLLEKGLHSKALLFLFKIINNLLIVLLKEDDSIKVINAAAKKGIITTKEKNQLHIIRKMRNQEAHKFNPHGDTPPEKILSHILFSLEMIVKIKS